jgi:hypothetical protein
VAIDTNRDGFADGYLISGIGGFWAEEHYLSNNPQN